MKIYPEIKALSALLNTHKIEIDRTGNSLPDRSDFLEVTCTINGAYFRVYVDDEYDDLSIQNPALHLCLVLRALEFYHKTTDYLQWCKQL